MSRPEGGECRKEAASWEGEDGQCDSGIESLRSLPGGKETPPATAEIPLASESQTGAAEERLDSSYGSGALPEPLPELPAACRAEEPPPEGLSRQQLEALSYVSEDGDT